MIGMTPMTNNLAPYQPLPWQIEPWMDKSRIILITGSAGGGKSRVAAEKVHAYMLKYPGAMGLILRKTRQSIRNSTALFLETTVIGHDPGVTHNKSNFRFEYANGSILVYGGMANEEQREQIRSIGMAGGVDIIWMEEATRFSEADFNEVLARLRGSAAPWRQIILTTNPGGPNHWIKRRLIDAQQGRVFKSTAHDNPHNPPDYLEALKLMTGLQAQRLRDGLWVQAEGVVYSTFDDENITDLEPDPTKEIELAFDDGYIDPRAILFVQRTSDQVLVFDEIYHSKHLAQTCVQEVIQKCEDHGWGLPVLAVGSPEAIELRQRFRLANIPVRKKVHKIVDGINVVRGLIRDGNGKRTLQVHHRCKNLLNELQSDYKYPETGSRRDDEIPIDKSNHAADALRYWCYLRAR
jgi:phage terminase large subunit